MVPIVPIGAEQLRRRRRGRGRAAGRRAGRAVRSVVDGEAHLGRFRLEAGGEEQMLIRLHLNAEGGPSEGQQRVIRGSSEGHQRVIRGPSEGHQRAIRGPSEGLRGSSEGHQRVVRGPSSAIGRYLQPWVRMAGVPTSSLDGGVRLAVRALLSQLLSRLCRDVKGEHQSLSVAISHYQSQSVAISRNHAPAPSRNRGYSWVIRCHHAPAPRGSGNTISAPGS